MLSEEKRKCSSEATEFAGVIYVETSRPGHLECDLSFLVVLGETKLGMSKRYFLESSGRTVRQLGHCRSPSMLWSKYFQIATRFYSIEAGHFRKKVVST